MLSLLCCCYAQPSLSLECLSLIDKSLGNIKNAHKSMTFIGLIEHTNSKVSLVHYQFTPPSTGPNASQSIKSQVERILERTVSLKISQMKIARELGFDTSKEIYIKGETSTVMIQEIATDHSLIMLFEMNALKVEFFDCETFITTIDDLVVTLLEAVNYDKHQSNPDHGSEGRGGQQNEN